MARRPRRSDRFDSPVSPETSAGLRVHDEPKAPRKLASRHVTMITLGGIIGASLFVGSGNVIRSVGPAAVLSYLIGGLLVFLAMRMLGEMAAARPAIGSFMEYARVGLGNWAAYLVGWLYWYFWVGVLAYEAVLGGETLGGWFPFLPGWAWSFVLLAIFVGTNLISVRTFGEVEFWLASIKVVAIVVFLGAGILFAFGLWPNSTFSIPNLWIHDGFAPHGFGAAITGVALVIFSYFGTEIAVMAAAESEDPAKGIRQATSTVIWRILIFFVGAVLIIATIIPWNELPQPTDVQNAPFTLVFEKFGLPGAAIVMQLVIFTAVISVLNSGLYSASRMLSSLGEQGFAPRFVARKSRTGIPVWALLASTIGGVVATIVKVAAPESPVFDFIMNSAGLVALFVYVFVALTQMRLRQKMTPEEMAGLKLRMWLHPWLNIFLIAAIAGVFVIMLFSEQGRSQVVASLVATAALVIVWPFVRRSLAKRRATASTNAAAAGETAGIDPKVD
ncbi:amino acid permease [Pseudoclavibacter chungangensis]|uniref:Amino acid permease n=1 Tax=Pseudoclavibacter chungangensis TaxID=587635 RepID=A0A7J5BUL0_9MICO|nr:amino acid permease [Pseudoclavibacter chungangensis]KAB1653407.1 amino acid permease [Pseudoclavibacter chungangensis]KAB1657229.1 amino acid permease [Pseudoclavibacter chungangensis]NYJ66336.1 GABA permease [Pseudoclavibacter chungangensis]